MTTPKTIDIKELAEPLAAAAGDIRPSAEVNALADRSTQREGLRQLEARVPEGAGLFDAIRTTLTGAGVVVLRNVPVDSDTLLVLLGAAAVPAVTSEVTGASLVDHITPAATGAVRAREQNQRSDMLLHTDASAQQLPPDFVGLACVTNEGHGGRSILLDIDDAVAALDNDDETKSLQALQEPYPFIHPQHVHKPPVFAPVISRHTDDRYRVRYRKENLETGIARASRSVTTQQRDGLDTLAQCFESGLSSIELRLDAGDYLIFDNARYLHGRTEIEPGARRFLKRTYFGASEW